MFAGEGDEKGNLSAKSPLVVLMVVGSGRELGGGNALLARVLLCF